MTALQTLAIMLAGAGALSAIDHIATGQPVWLPVGAMVGLLVVELITTRRELAQSQTDRMRELQRIHTLHVDWLKRQSPRRGGEG